MIGLFALLSLIMPPAIQKTNPCLRMALTWFFALISEALFYYALCFCCCTLTIRERMSRIKESFTSADFPIWAGEAVLPCLFNPLITVGK